MKFDGNISMGAVCRAMARPEFAGAIIKDVRITVSYKNGDSLGVATFVRKGGDRLLVASVEIDKQDVLDRMIEEHGLDEDIDAQPDVDDRDLHDFIAACMAGDRRGAMALIPRLFNERNARTAEESLLANARRVA